MNNIIIASGPVIIRDNKVLLCQHGEDNFWKFCGGRVDAGEMNIKETARREAREELGIEIEILDEQPYFFYTEKEKNGHLISVILAHFLAHHSGSIKPGKDVRDWRWIEISELKKENLAPNIIPAVRYFNV